mmetsp:Transcript_8121/g.22012  ORF Transcript_8121/g.22012 Transcript_8121/m.22012 type:complete len:268 (+) Transcript_8121:305-1108(+)
MAQQGFLLVRYAARKEYRRCQRAQAAGDGVVEDHLHPDGPEVESKVTGMPQHRVDPMRDEQVVVLATLLDQVVEGGTARDHGQRSDQLRNQGYDEANDGDRGTLNVREQEQKPQAKFCPRKEGRECVRRGVVDEVGIGRRHVRCIIQDGGEELQQMEDAQEAHVHGPFPEQVESLRVPEGYDIVAAIAIATAADVQLLREPKLTMERQENEDREMNAKEDAQQASQQTHSPKSLLCRKVRILVPPIKAEHRLNPPQRAAHECKFIQH